MYLPCSKCICAHAKSVILFLNPAALLPKCIERESFDFISIRSTRFFVNSFTFCVLFCGPFLPSFTAIYFMPCLFYFADYFAYCAILFEIDVVLICSNYHEIIESILKKF